METMLYGRATIEVIEDKRSPHLETDVVLEDVPRFEGRLVWVRRKVFSFTRCRRGGYLVDYCGGGSSWEPEDNVRNFQRLEADHV